jgi:hypothetical protein
MESLIFEAKERVAEIARATKNCPAGKRTAIYESENGYTISYLKIGWTTNTLTIYFSKNSTKKQVLVQIQEYIVEHAF